MRCWIRVALVVGLCSLLSEGVQAQQSENATEGGSPADRFVSQSTGDAKFQIPIAAPRGTGGFQPQLTLAYSSAGGDGPFGVGWNLSLGEVRRATRFGTPAFDATDRFEINGELLVANPSVSGEYRHKTESFARITFESSSNSWTVEYPNGAEARYGTTQETRIRQDASTNPSSDSGPVFRWLISELEDAHGNVIRFAYRRDLDAGTAYPQEITYTYRGGTLVGGIARKVAFQLELRPDPQHLFTGSVEAWVRYRVVEIHSTVGASLFRRLVLRYSTDADYLTHRSRLISAQLFGDDCPLTQSNPETNCDGMPKQTFAYGDAADDVAAGTSTNWTTVAGFDSPRNIVSGHLGGRGADNGVRLGDIDGDGIADMVRATDGGLTAWDVHLGNGNGGWTVNQYWETKLRQLPNFDQRILLVDPFFCDVSTVWAPALDGYQQFEGFIEHLVFNASFDPTTQLYGPMHNGMVSVSTPLRAELIDVNGDGLADIVMSVVVGAGVIEGSGAGCWGGAVTRQGDAMKRVWRNTGDGWVVDATLSSSLPTMWSSFVHTNNPSGAHPMRTRPPNLVLHDQSNKHVTLYFDDHGARWAELNGDGRPDLLVARDPAHGRSFAYTAYLNLETGWVEAPQLAPPAPFVSEFVFWDGEVASTTGDDTGLRVVDLNGDGLSDLIKTGLQDSTYQSAAFTSSGIWLNTGAGWCSAAPGGGCTDAAKYALPDGLTFITHKPEAVYMDYETPQPPAPGGYMENKTAGTVVANQITFIDLNGDGRPDLMRSDGAATDGRRAWVHDPSGTSSVWEEDARFAPQSEMVTALRISVPNTGGGERTVDTGVRFLDLDLNGAIDLIRADQEGGDHARLSELAFSDRLTSHANGSGAQVNVVYMKGAALQEDALTDEATDDADSLAEDALPHTWSERPAVAQLTISSLDTTATFSYAYAAPRWCPVDRSSLGYRASQVTNDQDTTFSRAFFWQRHGRAGQRSRTEIYEDGVLLRQAKATWEVLDGDDVPGSVPGTDVGRLTSESTQAFFASGTAGALHRLTFGYDDANYGFNFIGAITIERPTGTLHVTREPVPADTGNWVIGLLGQETLRQTSSSGVVLSRHRFQYAPGTARVSRTESDIQLRQAGAPLEGVARTDRTYDALGNLRSVSEVHSALDSHVREFCYDGDAQFPSGGGCPAPPSGSTGQTHTVPIGVRDPIGGISRFDVNLATGSVLTVERFNGDRAWIVTDGFGRPEEQWVKPVSHAQGTLLEATNYFDDQANPAGRPFTERIQAVGNGETVREAEYFDGIGATVRSVYATPQGFAGSFIKRDYKGRPFELTNGVDCDGNAHCSVGFPTAGITRVYYDGIDRPLRVDSPDAGIAVNAYSGSSRIPPVAPTGPFGEYDVVLTKDGNGNLTRTYLDGKRVVWVEECEASVSPGATSLASASCGANPATTFYSYDATGEVAAIYDATQQYASADHRLVYVYDTVGHVRQVQDPDGGTTQTAYHLDGEVKSVTNARGQETIYGYDLLGRLATLDAPPGENDIVYLYDSHTRLRSSATIGGGVIQTQHFYDDFGREERKIASVLTTSLVMDFQYDLLGRTTQVIYPDSTTIHYVYDGAYLEKVCEVNDDCDQVVTTWISDVAYDDLGREVGIAQPFGTQGFEYDAVTQQLERLTFQHTASGQLWLDLSLGYDPLGNVQTITDAHNGPTADAISASGSYTYDRRNRLSSWTWNGTTKHFGYDLLGNLARKAVASPTDPANLVYGDPTRPHAVTQHTSASKSFEYDADGNMTRRGGQYLKYDSANQLVCVGTTSNGCDISQFGYDAGGVQVADLGDHTRILFEDLFVWEQDTGTAISTIYATGRSLGERHRSGASLRTAWLPPNWEPPIDPWLLGWLGAMAGIGVLLFLAWRSGAIAVAIRRPVPVSIALLLGVQIGIPLEAVAGGGGPVPARRWTYQDHLGNQVLYLNETPDVIYRRVFEPYGGVVAESTGAGSHERIFTSKREDTDSRDGGSGLINFGARWYDADIGRFLSIDPIVQNIDDPQTHNPYGYVRNNPVTLIDPDGRSSLFSDILLGFGFAAFMLGGIFAAPLAAAGMAAQAATTAAFFVGSAYGFFGASVSADGHAVGGLILGLVGAAIGAVGSAGGLPFAAAAGAGGEAGSLGILGPLLMASSAVITNAGDLDSTNPDSIILGESNESENDQSDPSSEGAEHRTRESYGNNMSGFDLIFLVSGAWSLIRLGWGLARAGLARAVAGSADDVARGATQAADDAARYSARQLEKFERQLKEHGRQSLERSKRSIQRRLEQHREALGRYRQEGGYTSSVEREISNFERELEAIGEVLRRAP